MTQPHPSPQYVYVPATAQHTNGFAVAALVLGILWIWWIGSILAVIFGMTALSQIDRDGSRGRGMAIAGLVLGWIGVGTLILTVVVAATG